MAEYTPTIDTDSIDVTDSTSARLVLAVTSSDTVDISDSLAKAVDYHRPLSEDYYAGLQFNSKASGCGATFGRSTAIDGDWMVVTDNGYGSWIGCAWMFQWTNGMWVYKQQIKASDESADARFGNASDMHGDTMVIGASYADVSGLDKAGAAYVYVRNASGLWEQQQKLTMASPAAGQYFGSGVAISGSTIAVAAYGTSTRGKLHIFTRSGVTWSELTTLEASDKVDTDAIGMSDKRVSLCKQTGTTLVAGAPLHGHSGYYADSGAAYVWTYSGSWTQQQDITTDVNIQQHYFGFTVHVDGDTLAVGAAGSALQTGSYPSASVYTRTEGTWSKIDRVSYDDANARGDGGWVAISEDSGWLVVGYPRADLGGIANNGILHFYKKSGSTYPLVLNYHNDTVGVPNGISYIGWGLCMESTSQARVSIGHFQESSSLNSQVFSLGTGCFEITESLARADSKTTLSVVDTSISVSDSVARAHDAQRFVRDPLFTFTKEGYQNLDVASSGTDWPLAIDESGDYLYVGDPGYSGSIGRVLVYQRSGTAWSLLRTIANPDSPSVTCFGAGLSASQGSVAIGAHTKTVGGYANNGTVWIFSDYGATQQQETCPSYRAATIYVGYRTTLALKGDKLVIGLPNRSVTGWYVGGASYWTRSGGVWTEGTIISPASYHAYWGQRIAIDEETMTIVGGTRGGSTVYILRWGGSSWSVATTYTAGTNHWTKTVAVSGNYMVWWENALSPGHTDIVIYKRNTGTDTWQFNARLQDAYTTETDYSVRLGLTSDGRFVWSPVDGKLRVYSDSNGTWAKELELTNDMGGAGFALHVAIGGTGTAFSIAGSESTQATGNDVEAMRILATPSFAVPDGLTEQLDAERPLADTVEVTDTLVREPMEFSRAVSDSGELAEALLRDLTLGRQTDDSSVVEDSVACVLVQATLERVAEDTIEEVIDSGRRYAEFYRTANPQARVVVIIPD